MTLFEHTIWPYIAPYIHIDANRGNVDVLQLPDQLRELALGVVANCISCGAVISPLRARAKSSRSRVANTGIERRLFYAPTCPSDRDSGCSRSKIARAHKIEVMKMFGIKEMAS